MVLKLILSSVLGSSIGYFGLIIFPSAKKGEKNGDSFSLEKRIENWTRIIKMDKRCLFFDIFFSCIVISIAYTIIILDVVSVRQALLGGLTAEAFFYHYIHNARNGNNKNN